MEPNASTRAEQQLCQTILSSLPCSAPSTETLQIHGEPGGLPSVYAVGRLATASTAAATLSVANLWAARNPSEAAPSITIDRQHAAVAFRSERYLRGRDSKLPQAWDPLAGDYRTRDGFIRLHTNYRTHRTAVLRVLGCPADRAAIAKQVARHTAAELEQAVVDAGGAAAAMRTIDAFRASPEGQALYAEPLIASERRPGAALNLSPATRPLAGVRILDLTRVIAGPLCTRFLAAHGADVLRIDPPGFEEVPLLLPEVTPGKRRASLDLKQASERQRFATLVAQAHVVVDGYRKGALDGLGLDEHFFSSINPNLIRVSLNAYGHSGSWATRRGFDSLVQMSLGIAARTAQAMGSDKPGALPAQALDHASGYLLAATVANALTGALAGQYCASKLSLARTGKLLLDLGDDGDVHAPAHSEQQIEHYLEVAETSFGRVERVRCVGEISGQRPHYEIPAGALGSHPAAFLDPPHSTQC